MALDTAKNFAKATVSTGYDASATSIVLSGGHGAKLPTVPFNATWWNSTDYPDPADDPNVEIVRVTAISTDTLTVTRAQESTSASTKNTAGKTYKMIAGLTAKSLNTDIYTSPTITTPQISNNATLTNTTVGATSTDGHVIQNTTAATVGAQKWSPRLRWTGQGWATTPVASQTVDMIAELQPVQGAANPAANLVISSQINGGGYTAQFVFQSSGRFSIGGSSDSFPALRAVGARLDAVTGAAGSYADFSSARLICAGLTIVAGNTTDGVLTVTTNGGTGARALVLGQTQPSYIGAVPSHGQSFGILQAEELLTIAAAATTTTAMQLPAGAVVLAVSVRVTTVIPTAATFTVKVGAIVFNTAAVSTAANSTDRGTAAGAAYNSTAQGVTITPNVTPGAATGVVRVTVIYYVVSPPTS